jgi:hypothetical protein
VVIIAPRMTPAEIAAHLGALFALIVTSPPATLIHAMTTAWR